MEEPNYMTATEAARALGVARCTVYRWVTVGKLRAHPTLHPKRIVSEDVKAMTPTARIRKEQAHQEAMRRAG